MAGVLALSGCYATHGLDADPGAPATPGSPGVSEGETGGAGLDAGVAVTRPGPDGTPVRCYAPDAPTLDLGPEAECTLLTVSRDAGPTTECAFYAEHLEGVPVRVVRRAPGRLDLRARERGAPGMIWGVFPLSADTCWACPSNVPNGPGLWTTFRFEHVEDLMELLVQVPEAGTVDLEACFDPGYGPPRWEEGD